MSDHHQLLDLANDFIEKGDYEFAIACYNKAILKCQYDYDEKARITLMEGKAYLAIGNNEKAIEDFNYAAKKGNKEALDELKKLGINNTPHKPVSSGSTTAQPTKVSTPPPVAKPAPASNSPFKGYVQFNDGLYFGDRIGDKAHGRGKIDFKNGDVYEGEFAENKIHGKGKMIYKDGRIEEGQWEKGNLVSRSPSPPVAKPAPSGGSSAQQPKPSGSPLSILEYYKNNQEDFSKKFSSSSSSTAAKPAPSSGSTSSDVPPVPPKFTGRGKYYLEKNLAVYEGEFKNGKPHGKGKMVWTNDLIYEGEFKNGERHGKGKKIDHGEIKEGKWRNNEFQG